ncbi:MAG TPA: hypothetical protein GX703_00830 [Erysipelothrix sp.]|jgi:hypothetical protein|nr:hypothetical protein [Erysipelothrix sp.]
MFNRVFVLLSIVGLIIGGLLIWILKDLPLLVLFVAVVLLPMSFFYTQVKKRRMEKGVILTWLGAVAMAMVTLWVYQFFVWPPTILKVLLLNIQVLMTAEVLFVLVYYLSNLNEINNYLHLEVFIIKIIQLLVSILAPMAAYDVFSYTVANTIVIVSLIIIWIRTSYVIAGMNDV